MWIKYIRLKNFGVFKDLEIKEVPKMCVFVGANGTGKSTLFNVFSFLQNALKNDVSVALASMGGLHEVRSHNTIDFYDLMEIELRFGWKEEYPLVTYLLRIDSSTKEGLFVELEILSYRAAKNCGPLRLLSFSKGKGHIIINEYEKLRNYEKIKWEPFKLDSPIVLGLKTFSQLKYFPTSQQLGTFIERVHIHSTAQDEHEKLATITKSLEHTVLKEVIELLQRYMPFVTPVDFFFNEEGRILLRFNKGSWIDPFSGVHPADGAVKMFTLLLLLHDPRLQSLLCVGELENQLYPSVLTELASDFRSYAHRTGQIFISTHSPEFLNACDLEEVFLLKKENGYSIIKRACDDKKIKGYMENGDQLGQLWRHRGFFE